MRIAVRFIIACVCAAAFVAPEAHAVVIVNGDLTGPVTTGSAPPGWFNWQGSPDTADATGPFNNTPNPWILSPNGGTFARTVGTTGTSSEAIAQDVTGFTAGESYEISFFQANLGFENASTGAWGGTDGFYEILIDGALAASSSVLTKPTLNTDPITWFASTVSFVAPSTDFELTFVIRSASTSGLSTYMGIDGIDIRSLPGPGVIGLLVLAGLGRQRRRHVAS